MPFTANFWHYMPTVLCIDEKYVNLKLNRFKSKDYVRAYIGGSSSSASGAYVDTGRQYSNGDIYKSATLTYYSSGKHAQVFWFPVAYAKYGK